MQNEIKTKKMKTMLYCKYCKTFFEPMYPNQKYTCGKRNCRIKDDYERVKIKCNTNYEYKIKRRNKMYEWRKNHPDRFKEIIKKYQSKPDVRKHLNEYQKTYYLKERNKHNKAIQKWRKTENGRRYEQHRRNKEWIQIFPNIFPKEIPVDFHHIEGKYFVVPIPKTLHRASNGRPKNLKRHIDICNEWIEFYYNMNPKEFLEEGEGPEIEI